MLVWGMDEVSWWVQGMWVVHMVHLLCLNAADVLWMSMVHGMRGVGGVCERCLCLARGDVGGDGGEWMRGLGLGFTKPVATGGVLDVCRCFGCGGVGVEWVCSLDQGLEGWCYVCVRCESGLSV